MLGSVVVSRYFKEKFAKPRKFVSFHCACDFAVYRFVDVLPFQAFLLVLYDSPRMLGFWTLLMGWRALRFPMSQALGGQGLAGRTEVIPRLGQERSKAEETSSDEVKRSCLELPEDFESESQ